MKSPRGVTLRLALLGGFGLTLGLWLFAGYLVTARIGEARTQAAIAHLQDQFVALSADVAQLRAQARSGAGGGQSSPQEQPRSPADSPMLKNAMS